MKEGYSGYMTDRISDPLSKKRPQFTDEAFHKADNEIRNNQAAVAASRPPEGNRWSDSEDSDDLVVARLAAQQGIAVPITEDVAKAQANAQEELTSVRGSLRVIEGGKQAEEEPTNLPSSTQQEKTG